MGSQMGRFLVSLTTQERRNRAWKVIEFYKSPLYLDLTVEDLDAGARYIESASTEPNPDRMPLEAVTGLCFTAKANICIVNIIHMTASVPPKSRKDKVAQLIHGVEVDMHQHLAPQWTHFMSKIKAIDCLSAPDMFGDAMVGLVLLFPYNFNWSMGGTFGSDSNEKMQRAVRDAIKDLPELLELARELAPHAIRMGAGVKLPSLPTKPNPVSSSGLSESRIPRSEVGIVAYRQHPPTARDAFEVGLGANTLPLPRASFPIVYGQPSQPKSTRIDIMSLLS